MARDGRRSISSGARSGGGSNGDISAQIPTADSGQKEVFEDEKKSKRFTTALRVITVLAYVISVSTAAALLSAYYIFLWEPQPSEPLNRITETPYSLAQHGNTHYSGGSYYHYPKNSYSNVVDAARHLPPSRSKKSHYKTTPPPNFLPRPQYLIRRKGTARPAYAYSTPPAAT